MPIASRLSVLEPHVQEQIRSAIGPEAEQRHVIKAQEEIRPLVKMQDPVLSAVGLIITDPDLKSRCVDLLKRTKHFDRVMREATVILEDRIRNLSGDTVRLQPIPLINWALSPDPSKAVLIFGTSRSEQEGFYSICKGIILAIRNNAHHLVSEEITREEALKFCGFIDILLQLLSTTIKRVP